MTEFYGSPQDAATPAEQVAAVVAALSQSAQDVLRIHQASDVDGSPLAQHHTLGGDGTQAAAGNHEHVVAVADLAGDAEDLPGHTRNWSSGSSSALTGIVLATAETKDTGIGNLAFTARTGRRYTFRYVARVTVTGAVPTVLDARIRVTTGSPPASPTNADTQVAGASTPVHVLAGPGAVSFSALDFRDCPSDIAPGSYLAAAFYDVTAGGGTATPDQAAGGRRVLTVEESIGS